MYFSKTLSVLAIAATARAAPVTNTNNLCQDQVVKHTFDTTNANAFLAFPGWTIGNPTASSQRLSPASTPNVALYTFPVDIYTPQIPAAATMLSPEGIKFNLQSFYVGGENATWLNIFGYNNANDRFPVVAKQFGLDSSSVTNMQMVDATKWLWPDVGMVHIVLSQGGDTQKPVSFAVDDVVAIKKC